MMWRTTRGIAKTGRIKFLPSQTRHYGGRSELRFESHTRHEQSQLRHAQVPGVASAAAHSLARSATAISESEDKVPLVDSHGRIHNYLRISLTERCNLRCTYCMPEKGVDLTPNSDLLTDDEIVRIASVFVERGVDKIRLTGGEPLLRPSIIDLCGRLRNLGIRDLAITTNGILLKRKMEPLVESGVNLLNVSLDTFVPAKFELITRRRGFEQVLASIKRATELPGLERVKVNCVMKRGVNDDELLDFVEFTRDLDLEVRFIEFMPFDQNKWKSKAILPYYEMVDMIRERWPEFTRTRVHDGANTVSKTWQVPGFVGRVGFISSMTDQFCGTCNRLRLTADGSMKACLFGTDEVSLRDKLRSGAGQEDLVETIEAVLGRKHAKLGGHDSPESIAEGVNRPMVKIGG